MCVCAFYANARSVESATLAVVRTHIFRSTRTTTTYISARTFAATFPALFFGRDGGSDGLVGGGDYGEYVSHIADVAIT